MKEYYNIKDKKTISRILLDLGKEGLSEISDSKLKITLLSDGTWDLTMTTPDMTTIYAYDHGKWKLLQVYTIVEDI